MVGTLCYGWADMGSPVISDVVPATFGVSLSLGGGGQRCVQGVEPPVQRVEGFVEFGCTLRGRVAALDGCANDLCAKREEVVGYGG